VTVGPGETVDVAPLADAWGPAQVLSGGWEPAAPGAASRVWSGTIAVYQLGDVTVPPVEVPITKGGVPASVATESLSLVIRARFPPRRPGRSPPTSWTSSLPRRSLPTTAR